MTLSANEQALIIIFAIISMIVIAQLILRTVDGQEEMQSAEASIDRVGMHLDYLALQMEEMALASRKAAQATQDFTLQWVGTSWEVTDTVTAYDENASAWCCDYCGTPNDHPIHSCTKCGAPEPRGKQW